MKATTHRTIAAVQHCECTLMAGSSAAIDRQAVALQLWVRDIIAFPIHYRRENRWDLRTLLYRSRHARPGSRALCGPCLSARIAHLQPIARVQILG